MKNGLNNESTTEILARHAGVMPAAQMTLTEQKLCRLWLGGSCGGDWWDVYQQMRAIADVLKTVGQDAAAEMFSDAGLVALARCVYEIENRDAA